MTPRCARRQTVAALTSRGARVSRNNGATSGDFCEHWGAVGAVPSTRGLFMRSDRDGQVNGPIGRSLCSGVITSATMGVIL